MILYTSDYSKIYKLRYRPQGWDTIRLGIKWAQSSKLKAQSYPQITQITQIFKFKTKKLGGSKAGILFATDPASLWRATQDRPGFALASFRLRQDYAGTRRQGRSTQTHTDTQPKGSRFRVQKKATRPGSNPGQLKG
jgi:hypothetical protein